MASTERGDSSSRFGDKEIFLRKVQAGVGSWSKSNKGNVERNTFQADHSGKGNFPSERLVGMQGPYCELLDLAGMQNMVRMRWSQQTGVKHPWAFLWHLGIPEHIGCTANFYGILWFLPSTCSPDTETCFKLGCQSPIRFLTWYYNLRHNMLEKGQELASNKTD